MAGPNDNPSMAVFCDFENVAIGVRDARYDKFDIKRVLERLLLKGSIVVKKAYCDWDRYKAFKAPMHEASFELIEIPHVRQSGKNSADIRMVVDALDLCYTKSHVDTFVIISGDSDFSPLVSKLRENAKQVIGVGVKQSTSDLLIANCDEFIFYDDLVREAQRAGQATRRPAEAPATGQRTAGDDSPETPPRKEDGREDIEARRRKALDMAAETFDALLGERGASGRIWASVLKDAMKRRKPDFNESRYGFRTFGGLLDEAQARGLLEVGRDEKSNTYVRRASGGGAAVAPAPVPVPVSAEHAVAAPRGPGRRSGRSQERRREPVAAVSPAHEPAPAPAAAPAPAEGMVSAPARPARGRRKPAEAAPRTAAIAPEGRDLAPASALPSAAEPTLAPAPKKRPSARRQPAANPPVTAADRTGEPAVAEKHARKTAGRKRSRTADAPTGS